MSLLLVVAAALIDASGRVLLAERPNGKDMAGLWEFPGGKVKQDETPEQALCRELFEELNLSIEPSALSALTFASFAYPRFHLLMPLYTCRAWTGILTPREKQAIAWVEPQRLKDYCMPPADGPLAESLLRHLLG